MKKYKISPFYLISFLVDLMETPTVTQVIRDVSQTMSEYLLEVTMVLKMDPVLLLLVPHPM